MAAEALFMFSCLHRGAPHQFGWQPQPGGVDAHALPSPAADPRHGLAWAQISLLCPLSMSALSLWRAAISCCHKRMEAGMVLRRMRGDER